MESKEFIELILSQKPNKMTNQEKECVENLLQVKQNLILLNVLLDVLEVKEFKGSTQNYGKLYLDVKKGVFLPQEILRIIKERVEKNEK